MVEKVRGEKGGERDVKVTIYKIKPSCTADLRP